MIDTPRSTGGAAPGRPLPGGHPSRATHATPAPSGTETGDFSRGEVDGPWIEVHLPDHLELAIELLAAQPRAEVDRLKIWSGEHLAALILTAFTGHAPRCADAAGEVDLVFDLPTGTDVFGGGRHSVEVKTVPGPFRHWLHRATRQQTPPVHGVPIVELAIVESEISIAAATAAAAANRRCDGSTQHAFVIVHPFDMLAPVSIRELFTGPFLTLDPLPNGIESLTVLLWPEEILSRRRDATEWTQALFGRPSSGHAGAPRDVSDDPMLTMHEAEGLLLDRLGIPRADSPFQIMEMLKSLRIVQ